MDLGSITGKLVLQIQDWEKGIAGAKSSLSGLTDSVEKTTSGLSGSLQKVGQNMQLLGGAMSAAITAPLVLYGKQAIDLAVQIETKWAEVQKVYGDSSDAFIRDQGRLQQAVDELTVKFGKQKGQTLDALGALAAMGYEGEKAISMLTNSMEFATTGGMELNEAMENVVAISKIYRVEGDKLRETLALLNTVENATGASMQDLGIAISTAGDSALSAGVDVGEFSAMVAALRERAIPAGEAANALKTILTKVYKVKEDALGVYQKYGIAVEETTQKHVKYTKTIQENEGEVTRLQKKLQSLQNSYNDYSAGISGVNLTEEKRREKLDQIQKSISAVNTEMGKYGATTKVIDGIVTVSNGKFKDGEVILQDIAKSWTKMTDAEKFYVIESNAGMHQRSKFIALMEDMNSEGSTYYKTLDAISDSTKNLTDYEREMAVFLDTSAVKLQQNKAAWDNVKISIGSVLLEALVPVTQKLAELAKWFNGLNPTIQKAIVYFGMFVAVLGPLIAIFGTAISVLPLLATAFVHLGIPVLAIAGLVMGAITAFNLLKDKFGDVETFISSFKESLSGYLGEITGQFLAFGERVYDAFNLDSSNISFADFFNQIKEKIRVALEDVKEQVKQGFINAFNINFGGEEGGNLGDLFGSLIGKIAPLAELFLRTLTPAIDAFKSALERSKPYLDQLLQQLGPILVDAIRILAGAIGFLLVGFTGFLSGVVQAVSFAMPFIIQTITGAMKIIGGILDIIVGLFTLNFEQIWKGVKTLFTGIWDFITGMIKAILASIGGFIKGVIDFFVQLYETLVGHSIIPDMVNEIIDWIKKLPVKALEALNSFYKNIVGRVKDTWTSVTTEVSTWPGKMFDWGVGLMQSLADGISDAANKVIDGIKGVIEGFRRWLEGNSPPIAGPLKHIDDWGFNIGFSWGEGVAEGMNELDQPRLSDLFEANQIRESFDYGKSLGESLVDGFKLALRTFEKEALELTGVSFDVPELAVANVNATGINGKIEPLAGGGQNIVENNPTFEVHIGMYAGSEMEKRAVAKEIVDAYENYLNLEGRRLATESTS